MSEDRGVVQFPRGARDEPAGVGIADNPHASGHGPPLPGADAAGALERRPLPGFELSHGYSPQAGQAPAGAAGVLPPPGMMLNPDFVQWQQMAARWQAERRRRQMQFLSACTVIRRDVTSGYRIDIEADSTVAPDEQAEKQARTEFLSSIMPMLQMLIPEAQQNPAVAPLVKALVMFGVRAFPAARGLEDEFERAFAALAQSPTTTKNPGNVKSPMEIASEAAIARGDQQVDAAKVQVESQKNAADLFKSIIQLRQTAQQNQVENTFRAAELQQQGREQDQRSQLDMARLAHLMVRDTAGLI